ncbi:MAG: glycosyltransferase 87 family protein [Gammaproteobacteria bacterium]
MARKRKSLRRRQTAPQQTNETLNASVTVFDRMAQWIDDNIPPRALTGTLIFLCIAVAIYRVELTTQIMHSTTDTTRWLLTGIYVIKLGLASAGQSLQELNPELTWVEWGELPWNYPVIPLLFFTLISKLWASLFFAKLSLTLLEAVNAYLVYRFTGNRWLGLLYWMWPISLWWASHEGQFEPVQNFFVLLALLLLARRPVWSLTMLAVAIQVKLTAGAFLPYFAYRIYKEHRQKMHWIAVGFVLGFIPTLIAGLFFPVVMPIVETLGTLDHNAWYWNWTSSIERGWPYYIRYPNQLVSYSMLAILLVSFVRFYFKRYDSTQQPPALVTRRQQALECTPAIIFLLFAKTSSKFMGWYWMALLPFLLIISNPRLRLLLIVMAFFIEVVGYMYLYNIVTPYVGDFYKNIGIYDDLGSLFNLY